MSFSSEHQGMVATSGESQGDVQSGLDASRGESQFYHQGVDAHS